MSHQRKPFPFTTHQATAGASQTRKLPTAPTVYRPQRTPKVLQKAPSRQGSQIGPSQRGPVAPPVYRPQPVPKVLQTKVRVPPAFTTLAQNRRVVAPMAREVMLRIVSPEQGTRAHFRSQRPGATSHSQTRTNHILPVRPQRIDNPRGGQTIRQPIAPPVYRCQPAPKSLQTKMPRAAFNPGRVQGPAPTGNPAKPDFSRPVIQPPIRPRPPARGAAPGSRGVIQGKGALKVIKTAELKEESEFLDLVRNYRDSRYVNMEWRGVTNGMPLYSDSFANCLAVVIHNQERDYGALMHLFPAVIGATDTQTLFSVVNKELKKMVSWNAYQGGKLELLLWKGISWAPLTNKQLKETGLSYAEYLGRKHQNKFVNIIDLMDTKQITADSRAMLYVPRSGTVYLVDRDTETKLHKLKRDTHSEEDADFAEIKHKMPGYYGKKQRSKAAKREKVEKYISQLETKSIEELQKILRENIGPGQSEERERAAIYLLEKKQHPGLEPRPPRIRVSDRELQEFFLKAAKREKVEMYISQLETKSIEELKKILRENIGPGASEERERAAIYLLEKKQHPGLEPTPPRIRVSDRELQEFL